MGRRPEESEAWPEDLDGLLPILGISMDFMRLARFLLIAVQHLHKHRTPAEPGRVLDGFQGQKIGKGNRNCIQSIQHEIASRLILFHTVSLILF